MKSYKLIETPFGFHFEEIPLIFIFSKWQNKFTYQDYEILKNKIIKEKSNNKKELKCNFYKEKKLLN